MLELTETVTGHIAVVQEQRFRMIDDEGHGLLLTLSAKAGVSSEDLCRFQEEHARVQVEYSGQPNLADGVARSVKKL